MGLYKPEIDGKVYELDGDTFHGDIFPEENLIRIWAKPSVVKECLIEYEKKNPHERSLDGFEIFLRRDKGLRTKRTTVYVLKNREVK